MQITDKKQKNFVSISVIIPVYNEESTIEKVIKSVINANTLSLKKEIIVINDGSTDGTMKICKSYQKGKKIRLFSNKSNMGKGSSLKLGFLNSIGDIVLIQDADLEYSVSDYPNLIEPIINGHADVVYGSRFINSNPHRVLYFYHSLGNKIITCLSNFFTNLNLSDIEVGFKIFKGDLIREIAPKLQAKKFGFEPEITAKLAKIEKIRIYEVGVSYFGRTYSEGKKIKWTDGLKAFFEIIKYNILS